MLLAVPYGHRMLPKLGNISYKKKRFLSGIAQITSPPPFFGRQNRRLARITEQSNIDYDNDVSDNN